MKTLFTPLSANNFTGLSSEDPNVSRGAEYFSAGEGARKLSTDGQLFKSLSQSWQVQ
jgi:hypothetical protein